MPETNIGSATYSDHEGGLTTYSVTPATTDAATNQKETYYDNPKWKEYLGYYKSIPELSIAIDSKATWTIGKGFKSNEITEMTLSAIQGWGNDSFNTILENCIRCYQIGGDSFCEIIRDNEGNLKNLKPLDPGSIRIVANNKGIILRYEQFTKGAERNKPIRKFQPEEIFHLARNRVADEIHGVSLIAAVENIILMRNEAMADYRKLLHRNVQPIRIWKLDTDDTTKIASFKSTVLSMKENFEDIFIPKGSVETEIAATPSNATLNPLPWIQQLNQYFFQATGVPQIIVGGAQEITEASAKIAYLAFEQVIEEEQLFIEEQVLGQLNLEINLSFPASLQNEMLSDTGKEETMQAATPEDTSMGQAAATPPQEPQPQQVAR